MNILQLQVMAEEGSMITGMLFTVIPRSMGGAIWDFVSTGITEKVRSLKDGSPNNVQVNVMGRAKLVKSDDGKGIDLNGHDQWVEVYRDDSPGDKRRQAYTYRSWFIHEH